MTPHAKRSWSRFFEEFRCRECGAEQAFRSRRRGFFEKHVLPLLLLQTVRCERCEHRFYVWRAIPALDRAQLRRKQAQKQTSSGSKSDSRVA